MCMPWIGQAALGASKKPHTGGRAAFYFVSYTGFEPVTSALSRQRSEPTELIALKAISKGTSLSSNINFL